MMKIIISGILGRMGKELTALIRGDDELSLVGGYDRQTGETVIPVSADVAQLPRDCDLVIDFSAPEGGIAIARWCIAREKPLVSGTTGFTDKEMQELKEAAERIPLFLASNMSIGINAVLAMLEEMPEPVYDDFDVEIVETHHRMKKDSPSGTAKTIARTIAEKSGKTSMVYGREGRGLERKRDEIGVHAVRGGTVVGTHSVFFYGDGESLEITHRAFSRKIFALGALAAGKWLVTQKPGLYSMRDLLS